MARDMLRRGWIVCCVLVSLAIVVHTGCSQGGGGTGNDNSAVNDNSDGGNDNGSVNGNDNGSSNDNENGGAGNENDNSGGSNGNDNGGSGNVNDNGGGDNDNDNGGDEPLPEVIDTGLDAHVESAVEVSNRLIAWRSNETGSLVNRVYDVQTGEDYDVTAAGATLTNDFAVSGTDLLLRSEGHGLYHFDAANPGTGTVHVSPGVLLQRIDFGRMDTDGGNLVAFITQLPTYVCWVDLNDSPLVIRTFGILPDNLSYFHASVDGTRIAVLDGDSKIVVRDTTGPFPDYNEQEYAVDALPTWPLDFKDGYLLYAADDGAGGGILHVIDTTSGEDTPTDIEVAGEFHTRGGRYCAFRDNGADDSDGPNYTSAVGDAATGDYDIAPRVDTAGRADAGWGASCALSIDGSLVFVAGTAAPTGLESDLLTRINGGLHVAFTGNFTPASLSETMLVSASNVSTGDGLVGMLLYNGQDQSAHIGYMQLD